jgi:hypothetical protein
VPNGGGLGIVQICCRVSIAKTLRVPSEQAAKSLSYVESIPKPLLTLMLIHFTSFLSFSKT